MSGSQEIWLGIILGVIFLVIAPLAFALQHHFPGVQWWQSKSWSVKLPLFLVAGFVGLFFYLLAIGYRF